MKKVIVERAIYGKQGNPLDYPGQIIEHPIFVSEGYSTVLQHSRDFSTFTTAKGESLDNVLYKNGVAQVQDRVAQIAFGANRNLENITWKFRNYHLADHSVSQDFIALPGFLRNADVVACNIGYWGYVYGGLLTRRAESSIRAYLQGTKCPVTILLLDQSQLGAVHRSEGVVHPGQLRPGVCCGVSDMEVFLSESVTCHAQVYSLSVPFLSFDGKNPVSFKTVQTVGRGDYPALSQKEIFLEINKFLKTEPVSSGQVRTPIAETLAKENAQLLKHGIEATRNMSANTLYNSVRTTLMTKYALMDCDGKMRCGLEDIYPVRSEENGWAATPMYRPQRWPRHCTS